MATYLKTFDQAIADMARHLRADLGMELDLIEGSIMRSLIEAVAFQVADLSERQERSILDSIPEAVFSAFGFPQLPAQPATGILVFSAPVPVNDVVYIPAGAEAISNDEQVFTTTVDAYLVAGQTSIAIPAQAQVGGAAGNIQALSITRLGFGLPGVSSVSNPQPFSGGQDTDTLEAQQARFASWLASLDLSNNAAMQSQLLALVVNDGNSNLQLTDVLVADAGIHNDIYPGTFQVHCYRLGGVPAALMAAVQAKVEQLRAGGCVPTIIATQPTRVDVSISVSGPITTTPRVEAAIDTYFRKLGFGQKVSYENLITAATNADPDIDEVKLVSPAADVLPITPYVRFEAGNVTVANGGA